MSANAEYLDHKHRQTTIANAAYTEWFNTLSDKEKNSLAENGIDSPTNDDDKVGGHSPSQKTDIANSPIASYTPDIPAQVDKPSEILADTLGIHLATASEIIKWHNRELEKATATSQSELLQTVIAGLLMATNAKISAAGLAFATNLDALNGLNQSEFAKQNNTSRQNISKATKQWQTRLGIKPSVHQKSEDACKTYATTTKNNHWRNRIHAIRSKATKPTHLPQSLN